MGIPLFDYLLDFVLWHLGMLAVSFVLVYVGGKRLPRDVPMGLVMSLFLPAFGHLYVYTKRSLMFVAALLALSLALLFGAGWWASTLVVTPLSFGLMYWRLVVRGEGAPPELPELFALNLAVDAATLARLNDLTAASNETRDAVVSRALAGLPLED